MWFGKGSTGDEREAAKSICNTFKKQPGSVFESQEKEDFWKSLGGKQSYSNDKRLQIPNIGTQAARLFEISNATGKINVEEIFQFTQVNLIIIKKKFINCFKNNLGGPQSKRCYVTRRMGFIIHVDRFRLE